MVSAVAGVETLDLAEDDGMATQIVARHTVLRFLININLDFWF